jgi:hypothetical protein
VTGSTLALIVIPIVTALGLAAWLAVVFYADAHPLARQRNQAKPADEAGETPGAPNRERKAALRRRRITGRPASRSSGLAGPANLRWQQPLFSAVLGLG